MLSRRLTVRADGGFGGDGGGSIDLTPLLRWLVSPSGLVVVAVAGLLLIAVLMVFGLLARRAIRRRLPAGRQLVDRAVTGWRAQALPAGPRRRLAGLRVQLEDGLEMTSRQAEEMRTTPAPLGMLPELAGRLATTGRSLDEHLRGLEREPDEARLAAALPAAEQQVSQWCAASASAREAARSAALAVSAGQLAELTTQVELEAGSVQAGVDYLTSQQRPHG
jgi:hypothetical protein